MQATMVLIVLSLATACSADCDSDVHEYMNGVKVMQDLQNNFTLDMIFRYCLQPVPLVLDHPVPIPLKKWATPVIAAASGIALDESNSVSKNEVY